MSFDVLDPIRYQEVPIQYEMQIESQHSCQLTIQVQCSEKSVQEKQYYGETQQIFETSPEAAMEAPPKSQTGMLDTIGLILGPIWEFFLP